MAANNITPVLMYTDTAEANRVLVNYNKGKEALQNVVNDFYDILSDGMAESPLPLTNDQFCQLFADPESLLFDLITNGEGISISGIEIDKKKAIEIIQKPGWYNQVMALITQFKATCQNTDNALASSALSTPQNIANTYKLTEGETVEFSTKTNEIIAGAGKKYAKTKNAIAMFQFTRFAVDKFIELGLNDSFGVIGGNEAMIRVLKESVSAINWNTGNLITTSYLGGDI